MEACADRGVCNVLLMKSVRLSVRVLETRTESGVFLYKAQFDRAVLSVIVSSLEVVMYHVTVVYRCTVTPQRFATWSRTSTSNSRP
jgi:hypothetical protein